MRASEIADRLARADAALWTSWMFAMQERATNPYGISIFDSGHSVALHCHAIPSTHFNRIMVTRRGASEHLDDLLDFFSVRLTPVRIDLCPFAADTATLETFAGRALHPVELQTNLFVEVDRLPDYPDKEPRVRQVLGREIGSFAAMFEKAYNYGRNTPPGIVAFRTASVRARSHHPEWRFFAAEIDGNVVAGGALHISDGVATLAGGATLPTHRGRGCQRALLQRRIEVARDLGAELIVSRCAVGSTSQRNMEALGLATAYTKLIWSQSPVGSSTSGPPPARPLS